MSKRVSLAFVSLTFVVAVLASALVAGRRDGAEPMVADPALLAKARRILDDAILIDGHNDLPWTIREHTNGDFDRYDIRKRLRFGHTDIPRLRDGRVKAQFWSVFVPVRYAEQGTAVRTTLEQIDLVYRMIRRYSDTFELARSAADVRRIAAAGKIASLIGVEGGHSIDNSLGVLRMYYELGARYMTLTHSKNTDWADSCTDKPEHGGLTEFGVQVVHEMNRLGMLVDISHVSHDTMRHVLRVTKAPVIASHSSAYGVAPFARNVPDDVLRMIRDNGGVVMVNFFPFFVHPEAARTLAQGKRPDPVPQTTIEHVLDHIDHIVRVAGIEHVGLGSDYDGIPYTPQGLEDVSTFPNLVAGLLRRGYDERAIKLIVGGNVLRVLEEAERIATKLQAGETTVAP